jgi:hypothetical protein
MKITPPRLKLILLVLAVAGFAGAAEHQTVARERHG